MTRFPSGDAARERRYLKAFDGLTQIVASSNFLKADPEKKNLWMERWTEMFNLLAGENEEKDDGKGSSSS